MKIGRFKSIIALALAALIPVAIACGSSATSTPIPPTALVGDGSNGLEVTEIVEAVAPAVTAVMSPVPAMINLTSSICSSTFLAADRKYSGPFCIVIRPRYSTILSVCLIRSAVAVGSRLPFSTPWKPRPFSRSKKASGVSLRFLPPLIAL